MRYPYPGYCSFIVPVMISPSCNQVVIKREMVTTVTGLLASGKSGEGEALPRYATAIL